MPVAQCICFRLVTVVLQLHHDGMTADKCW